MATGTGRRGGTSHHGDGGRPLSALPVQEIDRAWRLALALACGDEGGAEALVEEGARAMIGAGHGPGPLGARWLTRGVVRAFLERSGENPGAWGEQGRADVHGGTEDGLAPGPAPGGAASGVVAAPDRRGTLALLSALAARPRLAVVLTHLEDLTPGAIGELAGWHLPEVEDLERLGARRLLDEAMREVRQR